MTTAEHFDDVPAWLKPGKAVAIVTVSRARGTTGVKTRHVERATKTQVVLDDDTRIRKDWVKDGEARFSSGDVWATDVTTAYPADAPEVAEARKVAKAEQIRRDLRAAAAAVNSDQTPEMVQVLRDACDAYLASVK